MRLTLFVHVVAGSLSLLSGYVALATTKGASLHRRVGTLFVYVMSTMAITGLLVSAIEGIAPAINIPTALLTFYLVITSLLTVRRPADGRRWIDAAAMALAFATAALCAALGINAIATGGREAGLAYPLFLFGAVAFGGGVGDRRFIRAGAIRGAPRLRRHLWRMCFALFIASIAFFLGPDRLPEALRSPLFRATGVLAPIAAMSYWLWRIRSKANRTTRRVENAPSSSVTAAASVSS